MYYITIKCTFVRVGVFFSCENFMQRMQATGGPKDVVAGPGGWGAGSIGLWSLLLGGYKIS